MSTPTTLNVCEPSASAEYDAGLVQVVNAAPSRLHWNVAVWSESLNEKVAFVSPVELAGCDVIDGVAGPTPIVQV